MMVMTRFKKVPGMEAARPEMVLMAFMDRPEMKLPRELKRELVTSSTEETAEGSSLDRYSSRSEKIACRVGSRRLE